MTQELIGEQHDAEGRPPTRPLRRSAWWVVVLFLPARTALCFLAQAIAAGILALGGDATPWESSQGWWMVYGTIADLGCLAILLLLLRWEGRLLRNLFGITRGNLRAQFRAIPLTLIAVLPFVAASSAVSIPFSGMQGMPLQMAVVDLPAGAAWYSILVWPVIWAITEQLVYLGFLLPRLEVLTGRTWLAGLIVALVWGAQHLVLPFIADPEYLVSRFLSAFVVAAGMTLVYVLLKRRMLGTIVVHWLADAGAAVAAALIVSG